MEIATTKHPYEAPNVEVVEIKTDNHILQASETGQANPEGEKQGYESEKW